jgi:methionyl-tRNA formyltransferase
MHRIVFMGTPCFAELILRPLLGQYEIAAVVTQPDRPSGRGQKTAVSPVKALAQEHKLPVLQPRRLRDGEVVQQLRALAPEVIVVAAFGQILPPSVLSLPHYGSINVHGSLLPRHRGAAPVPAAILAGDPQTGITIMLMDEGLDTGPMLSQAALDIHGDDTTDSLTERLGHLGAQLLLQTLPRWFAGNVPPEKQDESQATYAGMLRREDGRIDWAEPADQIARRCRAFYPWPGAHALWSNRELKVLGARPLAKPVSSEPPGKVMMFKSQIAVVTGNGLLLLDEIQLAGKRRLSAQEFVRGQPSLVGSILR